MKNIRVYALILGEVIVPGNYMGCQIKEMEFEEQVKRKFKPIQGIFLQRLTKRYDTYATYLPYIDPLKLKSNYVIVYDSYETDVKMALGDAAKNIDRVCRYLSIGMLQDIKNSVGEKYANFYPYLYQLVKIYKLNIDNEEVDTRFKITNSSIRYPRRPEKNVWNDKKTVIFLKNIINLHDTTLERALKYLYRSSIGTMLLDSPEKVALDHFKSIEIIINSLSNKDNFKDRLKEVKSILNLSDDDERKINVLWNERSKFGDIAHPSKIDQVERYPNQFPPLSNVRYTGLVDSIAGKICLKYYEYKRSIFTIDIERATIKSLEKRLGIVNHGSDSNHYIFFTEEKNKEFLENEIKRALIKELNVKPGDIKEYKLFPGKTSAILRVEVK